MFTVSCSKEKTCKCTTAVNGKVVGEVVDNIEEGNCSDENSEITVFKTTTKVECVEQ